MTARADLDTIRADELAERVRQYCCLDLSRPGSVPGEQRPQIAAALAELERRAAALDRLAGCVILTREEADLLSAALETYPTEYEKRDARALLDARLGETKS